ncbi:Apolipoprotein N-acyltransferase [Gimesia panareensis]|uniref:Apolipoprotein N-acyltransferase n=1 Tax=Gimesia panareensis TaxID=2527978 RepID=A0A517QFZ4_9PLAN|nr:apolipoprotein N-acyltransferase [Gimesia panareensis]QDT30568.1 Apolipoprotein N-acyltransferase [Gimesia panareensis]
MTSNTISSEQTPSDLPEMEPQSVSDTQPSQPDSSQENALGQDIQRIINTARTSPAPAWGAWALSGLSAGLMWASFTPVDFGPLGWVCLIPLLLLVRLPRPTRLMYTATYCGGLLFAIPTLQWMRLGDATMYVAWIALAFYLAFYFPVFVFLTRTAVHRFHVPLPAAAPVMWVGLEYMRAYLLTGFSWYYIGHTQYRWTELIQISDITGAYGVSFIVVMLAACFADLLPVSLMKRLQLFPTTLTPEEKNLDQIGRKQLIQTAVCLGLFLSVLGYGYVRRSQAEFTDGARIALIQGNFPTSVKHDPNQWRSMYLKHLVLMGAGVRYQPDLVIWPETMFRWPMVDRNGKTNEQLLEIAPEIPLNKWDEPSVQKTLKNMSQEANAAMVIGLDTISAGDDGVEQFNSAVFVRPDYGITNRYDKIHRVPFGEYLPLRDTLPFLQVFSPYGASFGIQPGKHAANFEYKGWNFAPVICFEDTVPQLVRSVMNQSSTDGSSDDSIDCLINLTNDGWFHGSSELDQHLITASFRCVENRTPMVRAVNTGISAVIDGDGMIVEPDVFIDGDNQGRKALVNPKTGRWNKSMNAVVIDTVPLDNRTSLYTKYGDWFAGLCCFCALFVFFMGLLMFKRKPAPVKA